MAVTPKALADGQLPNPVNNLLTVTQTTIIPKKGIVLTNTDSVNRVVNVYVDRTGTRRLITPKDLTIRPNEEYIIDVLVVLENGDKIDGLADVAAKVDYVISGAEKT